MKTLTEEIFEAQNELNKFIFFKKALPDIWSSAPVADILSLEIARTPNKQTFEEDWLTRIILAANQEITELEEELELFVPEYSSLSQNAIVEIIDIVHFLVSIFILTGYPKPERQFDNLNSGASSNNREVLFLAIRSLRRRLAKLQDLLNWKWWSTPVPPTRTEIQECCNALMFSLTNLLETAGITSNTLQNVYRQKMEINMKRQKGTYSRRTKTEKDNKSIKVD